MAAHALRQSVVRLIAFTGLLDLAGTAGAGIHTWTGSVSQNFQTSTNWSPSGTPVDGDTATIALSTANVFLSATTRVDDLNLSNGALLRTNGHTLKVDDVTTLNKSTAEDVALTLSSGASGIDLDTNSMTLTNGARLVMEPDSQLRIVESASISANSSISGAGLIEITGISGNGFDNNGTLISQGLTLRRATHAGSTFDLDGPAETGRVNVTGQLKLETGLNDAFDGVWEQQFASYVEVVDFTLGPVGDLTFYGGSGTTLTTMQGRNVTFQGEVKVRRATGFSFGETQLYADTLTFDDGSLVNRSLDTVLTTQGHLVLGDADIRGNGLFLHYGDLTVRGHTLISEGEFFLDNNDLRELTIEPGASFVVEKLNLHREIFAEVEVGQNGLLEIRDDWGGVFGSVALNGANAIFRSLDPIRIQGSPTANSVTGSGRFEADTTLDFVVLQPGDGVSMGSLYFDELTLVNGVETQLDIGPSGAEQILVGGNAAIGSDLTLSLVNGFMPPPGSVYTLLQAGSLTGEFSGAGFHLFGAGPGEFFSLHYDATRVVAYAPLPGDANLDGQISGADYTIWADHFGQSGHWQLGDFNDDGLVTGADYTIWADHFGESVSFNAVTAVPEPSAGLLAITATIAAVAWSKRGRFLSFSTFAFPAESRLFRA